MDKLVNIGMIVILIGFILIFAGAFSSNKGDSKVAVGGFIGFIPFGFSNDKRMLWVLIAIMVAALIFWIFMNLRIK